MQNTVLAVWLAAAAVVIPAASLAQTTHDHAMPMPPGTSSRGALAEGEVRAVDRAGGTVVIKHGPLTALNMGPMTMEFAAKDPALLANVKQGDKVRFTPEQRKDGTLVVSTLQVVKN